jgi:hypothetical protein
MKMRRYGHQKNYGPTTFFESKTVYPNPVQYSWQDPTLLEFWITNVKDPTGSSTHDYAFEFSSNDFGRLAIELAKRIGKAGPALAKELNAFSDALKQLSACADGWVLTQIEVEDSSETVVL